MPSHGSNAEATTPRCTRCGREYPPTMTVRTTTLCADCLTLKGSPRVYPHESNLPRAVGETRNRERRRKALLTYDEFVALGDWHIRHAEHLDEYGTTSDEAMEARRHRGRAEVLYDRAAELGYHGR